MDKQMTLPGLQSELEPGEPVFVLRGRDPLAAPLVHIWAMLRRGSAGNAVKLLGKLIEQLPEQSVGELTMDYEKVQSAKEVAVSMEDYRTAIRN